MSTTIRLRLVIRRHAVPDVKLVWPCVANDDLTVARLLALVNEVVPLESGDWGLEDYVVELYDGKGDSFELLHFQPVGKVLKEDDQVLYDLQLFPRCFRILTVSQNKITFYRRFKTTKTQRPTPNILRWKASYRWTCFWKAVVKGATRSSST